MIDYLEIAQKYYAGRNDGFLTDKPVGMKLAEDDYVKVRYDAKAMQKARDAFGLPRWIHSRPSRITYPTAKELMEQYRRELAERLE